MQAILSFFAALAFTTLAFAILIGGANVQAASPISTTVTPECDPAMQVRYLPGRGRVWLQNPDVMILAQADDPRIDLTRQAVAYWNTQLGEIGSSFRFGRILTAPLASGDAQYAHNRSRAMLENRDYGPERMPHHIRRYCGHVVIILANNNFVSFAAGSRSYGLGIVAIKGARFNPFHLPNVTQNVIAHELGHILGLSHNADPRMLMCGRPSSCRPDAFQAQTPRFFPLTDFERERLQQKYPNY